MSPVLGALGVGARAFGMTAPSGSTQSFDELASTVLTGSQASVTFDTSTYTNYKHLQIRFAVRHADSTAGVPDLFMRFNGVSTSSYAWHFLWGNGSSIGTGNVTSASHIRVGQVPKNNETTSAFEVGIVDILDAFNTSKNKTVKSLAGRVQTTNYIYQHSGFYNSTNAITSITLLPDTSSFITGSRFSLYGLKG